MPPLHYIKHKDRICKNVLHVFSAKHVYIYISIASDVQGLITPLKVKGRGQEGKGQGKDLMTLNRPLTLMRGQGPFRDF